MTFELNPETIALGKEQAELHRRFSWYYCRYSDEISMCHAPVSWPEIDAFHREFDRMQKAWDARGNAASNVFEGLVCESALDAIRAMRHYFRCYLPRRRAEAISIDQFIEVALGPGVIDSHIRWLRRVQEEAAFVRLPEYHGPRKDLDAAVLKPVLEHLKHRVMSSAEQYRVRPVFPDDSANPKIKAYHALDIRMDPNDEGGTYHDRTHSVELSTYHFRLVRTKDGGAAINASNALVVLAHEIYGHALGHFFAQNLPEHLHCTTPNIDCMVTMPKFEGIACRREGFTLERTELGGYGDQLARETAIGWLHGSTETVTLSEEEVEWGIRSNRQHMDEMVQETYTKYLFHDEPDPQKVAGMLNDVLHRGQGAPRLYPTTPKEVPNLVYQLSYVAGVEMMDQLCGEIADWYTDTNENLADDETLVNAALSTGLWSWQTYPRWVDLVIENLDDFETEYLNGLIAN